MSCDLTASVKRPPFHQRYNANEITLDAALAVSGLYIILSDG